MIDRSKRDEIAGKLRQLLSGQITNYKFEDNAPQSKTDLVINEMREAGWRLLLALKSHVPAHL